jgi:hypothetical protein
MEELFEHLRSRGPSLGDVRPDREIGFASVAVSSGVDDRAVDSLPAE